MSNLTYKCGPEMVALKYLENSWGFEEHGSVAVLVYVQHGYKLVAEKISRNAVEQWNQSRVASLESKSGFGCGYRFIERRGDGLDKHKIVCVFI
ncbi:hypothetical protein OESDEN_06116 [Oesophagostomum dentatum]|uniref:SCP domain-containing protein n=1 Tax=Oesophagostomum dentatum TaxID=61180 RepID=A0A0B1T9P4_OESDE|nr:hypothetical protein OESDEN_06116 [Oesophagostomum dentatum]